MPMRVTVIDEVLQEGAENAALLRVRGRSLGMLNRWDEATRDYERVAELTVGEERATANLDRALALARLERWEESSAIFTSQLLAATGIETPRHTFAAQLRAGNIESAKVAARWLRHRYPAENVPYWRSQRVRANVALPDLCDKAKEKYLLNQAKQAPPEERALLTAAIHYRLGDLEKANELLEAPVNAPLFKALATMLLHELGKTD